MHIDPLFTPPSGFGPCAYLMTMCVRCVFTDHVACSMFTTIMFDMNLNNNNNVNSRYI